MSWRGGRWDGDLPLVVSDGLVGFDLDLDLDSDSDSDLGLGLDLDLDLRLGLRFGVQTCLGF